MPEIVHWNPTRRPAWAKRIPAKLARPFCKPVNNFGDILGPLIVSRLAALYKLPYDAGENGQPQRRLLTVGSILHLAQEGDVIWGSGRNGKVPDSRHLFHQLDIRAVRGPLSREWLERRGIACPRVYGDPALLVPALFPEFSTSNSGAPIPLTIVPNLNDLQPLPSRLTGHRLSPMNSPSAVISRIVQSRLVVASSLHAIIVAEAFGIPARAVACGAEPEFEYLDYFLATGRPDARPAKSFEEGLALGGERPIQWDPQPLLDSFPTDLFAG